MGHGLIGHELSATVGFDTKPIEHNMIGHQTNWAQLDWRHGSVIWSAEPIGRRTNCTDWTRDWTPIQLDTIWLDDELIGHNWIGHMGQCDDQQNQLDIVGLDTWLIVSEIISRTNRTHNQLDTWMLDTRRMLQDNRTHWTHKSWKHIAQYHWTYAKPIEHGKVGHQFNWL